jgi:serine/threonine protein kinase
VALTTGTRLGPYEILPAIGAGGMGEVYRGRDTRLDRTVANKTIPEALASASAFRERLEREGKAIAALQHPLICTLHDVGQERLRTMGATNRHSAFIVHDGVDSFGGNRLRSLVCERRL